MILSRNPFSFLTRENSTLSKGGGQMEFIVRECPNNGIFGGSFEKTITAYIVPQHSSAEISIEQLGERIITIHTVEDVSIYDLHHLYFDLKRLLMLLDGQFYPPVSVTQDGVG